ncbi:ABC transporter G family member 23 [Leptinotarsa decemlineata]|uniref:ABC transporter G family member 23 n=1 Tax=Leptinotarsa decemlineata TaxID=7539 RepID=UPI003D3093DA
MDNFAVHVRNVVKRYGNNQILTGLSMTVERGQIYGLLGASGCGKSTLMSSLVGIKKVDAGEIWVLGKTPGKCDMATFGARIGYMPQEMALVGEFTVKDSIYYFGRIFHMKDKVIAQRFREMQILLELPPEDRFLRDCSGGEQRRVSFAVALVHKPELLIMDEPTVGVEPLMRFRIWKHLIEITRTENISIILTTHYLEECREADKIGLIRNGKLLAEDSPNEILRMFNCKTLEEAFLILSRNQEKQATKKSDICQNHNENIMDVVCYKKDSEEEYPASVALLVIETFPQQLFFLVLLPVIQQVVFMKTLGRDVMNIPLGIVNDEIVPGGCLHYSANSSVIMSGYREDPLCHFHDISCRFLGYLDHPMISKVYYDRVEDAHEDTERGLIIGFVYFPANFSESLEKRMWMDWTTSDNVLDSSQVKVWLDLSSLRVGGEVQMRLQQIFLQFQKSLYIDCGLPEKLSGVPLNMDFIHGWKGEEQIVNMLPSGLVTTIFFLGAIMTSHVVVKERQEGIWDRSIVAGVTSLEILTTHFILLGSLSIIQTLGMFLVTYIIYQQEYVGSLILMMIIVYLQAIGGMSLGFLVSVISTDHTMATISVSGIFFPMMMLNGLLWPIQGMPYVLASIARCLPFTLATESLRNVSKKGWPLSDFKVFNGIIISTVWTIVFGLLSVYLMRKRS